MAQSTCTILIIVLILMVILSAFFSASETAFSSLNQIRLKAKADHGDKKAARILHLSQKYDPLLSTILIGNNIVNITMSSVGTVLFSWLLGSTYGATVSTIVITLVVLVLGEITPKCLAKEMPERFASFAAPVLQILLVIFTPLNFIFGKWKNFISARFHVSENDNITDDELVAMVNEAENDGELTARESDLIKSAIEFDDVEVGEILTPRVDVIAVSDEEAPARVEALFRQHGYSRIPVYHDTIDNIIGVIHEKDYYAALHDGEVLLMNITMPTLYTTESTKISELLRILRESHHHLAVVVDEYGGTQGIVTLEDILEELVGEIWDEHDNETTDFVQQTNGDYIVAGSAGICDLFELLGLPDEAADAFDANTLNGLFHEKLGHLAKVGDTIRFGSYEGTVTRTSRRRVAEARIRKMSSENEADL